jgi:hypothetical protein
MQDRIAPRPSKSLGKRIAHQSVGARGFEGAAGGHHEGGVADMLDLVRAVGSHDSLSGNRATAVERPRYALWEVSDPRSGPTIVHAETIANSRQRYLVLSLAIRLRNDFRLPPIGAHQRVRRFTST